MAKGINPSIELAYCENIAEEYNALMTSLESDMGELVAAPQDDDAIREATAEVRTRISKVRAAVGFWRGEASYWKNELQENKTALKESNNLSKSS